MQSAPFPKDWLLEKVRMFESNPKLWFATPKFVLEEHHLVKYLNFRSKKASK